MIFFFHSAHRCLHALLPVPTDYRGSPAANNHSPEAGTLASDRWEFHCLSQPPPHPSALTTKTEKKEPTRRAGKPGGTPAKLPSLPECQFSLAADSTNESKQH